jgi:hypothetical protein
MGMNVKRAASPVLAAVLIVHIGFGFLKQVKKAPRSVSWPDAAQFEPGAAALRLNHEISEPSARVVYRTDRIDAPGQRPAVEYYYDVQYGFAPFVVEKDTGQSADYAVSDFTDRPLSLEKKGVS